MRTLPVYFVFTSIAFHWLSSFLHGYPDPAFCFQHCLRRQHSEHLDQPGNQTGPAGLMARPEPGAVVPVEVFIEKNIITPVRVRLEFIGSPKHRRRPSSF